MRKVFCWALFMLCAFSFSANALYLDPNFNKIIPPPYDPAKDSISRTFEHLSLNGKIAKSRVDKFIIAKGDSVRIKLVFITEDVDRIEADNGARATREDIKKGEWIVTFKPQKTQWCGVKTYTNYGLIRECGNRIIVVDPNKYEEVMARIRKLKDPEKQEYIDSIAGGNHFDFYPKNGPTRWK